MAESRKELLKNKAEELERMVAMWAEENKVISVGERIVLTLFIEKTKTVATKVFATRSETHRAKLRPLSVREWRSILRLPLIDPDREVLIFFRQNNGKAFLEEDIGKSLPADSRDDDRLWITVFGGNKFFNTDGVRGRLNKLFSENGLPFRWKKVGYGSSGKYGVCAIDE